MKFKTLLSRKILSSYIVLSILIFPLNMIAQTASSTSPTNIPSISASTTQPLDPVADPTSLINISSSTTPPVIDPSQTGTSTQIIDPSQTGISPQITATGQQSAQAVVIIQTVDPILTATSGNPILPMTSTSTASTTSSVINMPSNIDPTNTDPSFVDPVLLNTQPVLQAVQNIPVPYVDAVLIDPKKLVPEESYLFGITGAAIPTTDNPEWKKNKNEKNINNNGNQISSVPNIMPNAIEGTLEVSGVCADPYFVVLLYKNQEDYDKNPGSYIFNKALNCVNGSYNYSIKDLPKTLSDGTYYLLIGGQGNVGSWKPITALMPITIQKQ